MRRWFAGGGLPWLLALLAGGFVRLWQLDGVMLVGDEWHAVNKLLTAGFGDIATDFGVYDHCIPLTLLYKLLAETVGLTEWLMRVPSLVFGVGAVVLIPWVLRGAIGRRASWILAFLLAFSPLHIFYSRQARPYALLFLLELLAMVAFYRWLRSGERRQLALCAAALSLGVWLNLSVGPLIAGLLIAAVTERLAGFRPEFPGWPTLFSGALALLAGPFLLLLPTWISSSSSVAGKVVGERISWATLPWAAELLLGTASWPVLAVLLGLLVAGVLNLDESEKRHWRFWGLAAVFHLAVVLALGPSRISAGPAFVRYSAFLCPLALALAARGLVTVGRYLPGGGPTVFLPAFLLLPCLVLLGPLPNIWRWPDMAALQDEYGHDELLGKVRALKLPDYYATLALHPAGSRLVVEAPYYFYFDHIAFYRSWHGQRTLAGFVSTASNPRPGEIPLGNRSVILANGVHVGDFERLRELKVDAVIFHKQLDLELPSGGTLPPVEVGSWIERYRRLYGAPVYEDSFLAVFQLRP